MSQFDKNDVETAGLVKFDFLGLRTLTIIDWAVKMINERRSEVEPLAIDALPLDDESVYRILQKGETTALFQLESRGMKELIKKLKPGSFEDIIALVALFRPGPLQSGMVDDFIERKHGRTEVAYPHPELEPVLSNTYGVILYQEQVMQIAQVLANYTLGGADILRKAMGKKDPDVMAKQRDLFMEGAVARQIDQDLAGSILISWKNSPAMVLISRTRLPMRWSPIRRHGSEHTIRSFSWRRSCPPICRTRIRLLCTSMNAMQWVSK